MDNGVIYDLAEDNPQMSDIDRLGNIYHLLSQVLFFEVPGSVVEIGCNEGKTSVFLQMIIDHYDPKRELHVYDSFKGLPPPGPHDAYLTEGQCATTVENLRANFANRRLREPGIHPGWFEDTLQSELPTEIAFAYFDSDFYESILVSWQEIYPRLTNGAIVVVDDYCDQEKNPQAWPGLPGVKRACDDFLKSRGETMSVLVGTGDLAMAYLRKAKNARDSTGPRHGRM